jgi:hypothetical protein
MPKSFRRLPSPSLAIALLALFISLSGTAVAAGVVVPLAKRALNADNAKKLQGKTPAQVAALAAAPTVTSVAPLSVVKTVPWTLAAGEQKDFTITCDAGQKAISGGWDDPSNNGITFDSRPTPDGGSWKTYVLNTSKTAGAAGTLYAVCLK